MLTFQGARDYVGPMTPCDLIDSYDPAKGIRVAKYFYYYIPSLLIGARRFRPQVIIQATAGVDTAIMAFIAKRLGVLFVHRIASDGDVDERSGLLLKPYERLAYAYGLRNADAVICQNDFQFQVLRRRFPNKPLFKIHNPFSLLTAGASDTPRSGRRYVAWIGALREPKNLPLLYDIARSLPDISFRIAGKTGIKTDSETAAALNNLRGLRNVEFCGYLTRKQIAPFLSQAVLLLCTSDYEGFSNTFLESFSLGTPVVTREIVNPDQIISKNSLGMVAVSSEDLDSKVRQLWDLSESEFGAISGRCQTYLKENHSPESMVQKLLTALAPMVGGKAAI